MNGSLGGLGRNQVGSFNAVGPFDIGGPVRSKPSDNVIELANREGLSFPQPGEEPAVSGAKPSKRCFLNAFRRAVARGEQKEAFDEHLFHALTIVGSFPLCNRKLPIRLNSGKFPIMAK